MSDFGISKILVGIGHAVLHTAPEFYDGVHTNINIQEKISMNLGHESHVR